ncbi:MAG: histidine kinase dimerization/phospho-acceptor domain-containing protein [bacterium]
MKNELLQLYQRHMEKWEDLSLYEIKIVRRDGTIRDVEITAKLIHYNDTYSALIIVRDTTDHKRMEEELQRLERLESLSFLAGGIAHDFNNILTILKGYLSLTQLSLDPESEAVSLLAGMEKSLAEAKNLTQQLLTFSKEGAP